MSNPLFSAAELFPKNTAVPTTKMISLYRNTPVELIAEYSDPSSLPKGSDTFIGKFIVEVPSVQGEPPKLRIKVKLDINGVVTLDGAELVETIEEAPPTPTQSTETAPATPPPESSQQKTEPQPEPMQDAVPTTPPPDSPSPGEGEKVRVSTCFC